MFIEKEQVIDWNSVKKIHPIAYNDIKDRELFFCKLISKNVIETDLDGELIIDNILDFLKLTCGKNVMMSDPDSLFVELFPNVEQFSRDGEAVYDEYKIKLSSADWTVFTLRKGNVWGTILRSEEDMSVQELKDTTINLFAAFDDAGMRINRLLSPAKMAEQIIRKTSIMSNLPNIAKGDIDKEVMRRAIHCFRGGRMEAASLGVHKNVSDYDLVRAYFSVLRSLPCIKPGFVKWIDSKEYIEEADFGFCLCKVDIPENVPLGPVAVRIEISGREPRVFYSSGESVSWRTKSEIDLIRELEFGKVEIIEGSWGLLTREGPKVFKGASKVIENLMNDERSNNFGKYIASTSWGKLASIFSPLYNPVYASYVTSEIRTIVTKIAAENFKDVIAIAVDGIAMKDACINENVTNAIGGFRVDDVKEMLSVGDFYRYNSEDRHPGWSLSENGVRIKFKRKDGVEGVQLIPYGSTKRKNPENLSLDFLCKNQFDLRVPNQEDVVEMYLKDSQKFPGTIEW